MAAGTEFTRRDFIQLAGSLTAFGGFASIAPWTSAEVFRTARLTPRTRFAFVASASDAIHVFAIATDGAWRPTQTVASAAPVSLALSPDQRFLYVANAISSFNHLPTGSVESFAVDHDSGALTQMNRQGLALSAVMPKHLAISPDGRHLAVAVAGGAAYNLLPLHRDGSIGRVTSSIKLLRNAANPSEHSTHQSRPAPQSVLFRPDGTLFTTDLGTNRISTFTVTRDGALLLKDQHAAGISVARTDTSGAIEIASRHAEGMHNTIALAVSQDGKHLFALHRADHSLTRFDIDLERARLSNPVSVAKVFQPTAIALKHL